VRAVRAVTFDDGRIEIVELPTPEPGPGEVLVRVHGAGLNRADLLQRAGRYPAPPGSPAEVPGLEHAGTVESLGAGVTALAAGDRVFGICGGGAQATHVVVRADQVAAVPDGLDLLEMGGVPEAFVTAHDAMCTQAGLCEDEWVLVHAVGSGVGTAVLQLATSLGARVVGTARTPDKLARCAELGLDAAIVPPRGDDGTLDADALAFAVLEATDGGAHVVVDLVGGPYVEADVGAAAVKGRIVLVGALAGGRCELPILGVMGKRLAIFGTVLRARSLDEKAAAVDAFARDVVPGLADASLRPVVEAVLPLERAAAAYELLASDATFGKVILDCR
jgi:NADPH:quinone reductase-like Zn-dependent oxidoreductase